MGEAIESFELVPRIAHDLVLAHVPGTRPPLSGTHAWHVLVEATAPMVAPSPEKALGRAVMAAIGTGVIEDAVIAASEAQAEGLWRIRESISEAEQKDGPAAKHDISVEVAAMPRFMTDAAAAVESRFPGTRVIAFGHLGDGNVHFNVRAPDGAGTGFPGKGRPSPRSCTIWLWRKAGRSRPSTASARCAWPNSNAWATSRGSGRCGRSSMPSIRTAS
jgi:FAD/FMN-containing dehydrogenase